MRIDSRTRRTIDRQVRAWHRCCGFSAVEAFVTCEALGVVRRYAVWLTFAADPSYSRWFVTEAATHHEAQRWAVMLDRLIAAADKECRKCPLPPTTAS